MLRLNSKITIGELVFPFCTDVMVTSSWKTLTDTASIILPRKIQQDGEIIAVGENGLIRRGLPVKIELGYSPGINEFNELTTVFTGYVTAVSPELPLQIECEDESWLLKQGSITISENTYTLKSLVDQALGQLIASDLESDFATAIASLPVNYTDEGAQLGSFRTENGSVAFIDILNELKRVYGLVCYVQDGELNIVFAGSRLKEGREFNTHRIITERNVISHNLVFVDEGDQKIKIRAVSMYPDNTKIEVLAGDNSGQQRTLLMYNVNPEGTEAQKVETLRSYAESEKEKYKYTGYRGRFTTFGRPIIKHGDRVEFENRRLPERNGVYQVDKVITNFGQRGFRQMVELGFKVSDLTL